MLEDILFVLSEIAMKIAGSAVGVYVALWLYYGAP